MEFKNHIVDYSFSNCDEFSHTFSMLLQNTMLASIYHWLLFIKKLFLQSNGSCYLAK